MSSEQQLESELNLTRGGRPIGTTKLRERTAKCSRIFDHVSRLSLPNYPGLRELDLVENVVDLRPELQIDSLRNRNAFDQIHVCVEIARPSEGVTANAARPAEWRLGECRGRRARLCFVGTRR